MKNCDAHPLAAIFDVMRANTFEKAILLASMYTLELM